MTPPERAAHIMEEAIKLGCDTPTESMIADALNDHEHDAYHRVIGWLRVMYPEAANSIRKNLESQTFLSNIHKQ